MSRPRLVALLLALVTLLVYLPAGRHGFINYDDGDYVFENPMVESGLTLPGLKWAFTTFHSANWHPLTWLSHMTDCELFGLNPGPEHLVNAIIHTANTVLLFWLLLVMTNRDGWRVTSDASRRPTSRHPSPATRHSLWPCAFIAALFAWHPLHVESVAWIAERKDVLSTFFGLLALIAYVKAVPSVEGRGAKKGGFPSPATRHLPLFLALAFFALSLMSKPMLVTLPFVMLLLDYWPLRRIPLDDLRAATGRVLVEKIPFFALTAASCVVTYLAQNQGAVKSLKAVPLAYRLENTPVAIADYLLKIVWPSHLAVIYPMPDSIPAAAVAAALAALTAITITVWVRGHREPFLLVGWLWFLGTLVPVIGLVKVGDAAMADRYTYIPSIGIFIMVAFIAEKIAVRFPHASRALLAAAVVVSGCLLFLTERQLRFWQNDETLFQHALRVTRNNADAMINYGYALEKDGRFDDALAQYRQAEKIAPDSVFVHNNLGNLLDNLGQRDQAVAEYRQAIQLDPNKVSLHDSLGVVLVEMGRFADGMAEFTNALRLNPRDPWPHYQLAKALLQQGRDAEAIDEFRAALKRDPNNFKTLTFVAQVLASDPHDSVRDGKTALALADKADELSGGGQPLVLDVVGMALAESGDFTNAIAVTQEALNIATAAGLPATNSMQQRLDLYQNRRPWRESFLSTNAPARD